LEKALKIEDNEDVKKEIINALEMQNRKSVY